MPAHEPPSAQLSRRFLLKLAGLSGAALPAALSTLPTGVLRALAAPASPPPASPPPGAPPAGALAAPAWGPLSPINNDRDALANEHISGDDPNEAHKVLWDPEGVLRAKGLSALPAPSERVKVLVVGGGVAGLTAAWRLRAHSPVVLERAARLGGNAKGEVWRGLPYSIGAAYLIGPEPGSEMEAHLKELGVLAECRVAPHSPMIRAGARHDDFKAREWGTPAQMEAWRRLKARLQAVYKEQDGHFFPNLPTDDPAHRALVNKLDAITFHDYLKEAAGGELPQELALYLEHYCWSAFGAGSHELSAASGLNFLAAEEGDVLVAPGGNSGVADALYRRLSSALPASGLRVSSVVFDVRVEGDRARVAYLDAAGEVRVIEAEAVVMACPKFVVKRVVRDLEPARLAAIARLKYRAYLVANALFEAPLKDDFYASYLLTSGRPTADAMADSDRDGSTDISYGNFARVDERLSTLTLYYPLPFDAGRGRVFAQPDLSEARARFERELKESVMPALKLAPESLKGLRLTRWGHALPVAAPGLAAEGVVDALRAPFAQRVFFAQQDSWGLPAFETATQEAWRAAQGVEALLKG
jgi:phytoene dehydrogenase-like protein